MTYKNYVDKVNLILEAFLKNKIVIGKISEDIMTCLLGKNVTQYDFYTTDEGTKQLLNRQSITVDLKALMDKSGTNARKTLDEFYEYKGFTLEELKQIEFTFENSVSHNYDYLVQENKNLGLFVAIDAVIKLMANFIPKSKLITKDRKLAELRKIYISKLEEQWRTL